MASVLTRLFGGSSRRLRPPRRTDSRHRRKKNVLGQNTLRIEKKTAPIYGDRQERAGVAGATADSRPRARSICDPSVLSDLRSPTLGRPSFTLCAKLRAKPQSER